MSARCPHTGLAIPECSCAACCRRQIREHAPWLLSVGTPRVEPRDRTAFVTRLVRARRPESARRSVAIPPG